METFFASRGYPDEVITRRRERASTKSRVEILKSVVANNTAIDRVPFVTTFHLRNLVAVKIILNFRISHKDSTTANIFNKPPLKASRRAKNLKDLLVRSSLTQNSSNQPPGTFPCNRIVCRTCPHINLSPTITTPRGQINVTGHYSCITDNVVYCLTCTKCPSTVYIGETGRRLADWFREHRRDIIKGRNDLPVPAHFNQENHTPEDQKVAVWKAGLANQEYRKEQEMRLIFNMELLVLVQTYVEQSFLSKETTQQLRDQASLEPPTLRLTNRNSNAVTTTLPLHKENTGWTTDLLSQNDHKPEVGSDRGWKSGLSLYD